MKLLIIAGGKGTRLGLKDIPKPMVDIAGKPLIQRQIELAVKYGIKDIIVLLGYLHEVVQDFLGNGTKFGINLEYVVENKPLGTAGAVEQLSADIDEAFIVFYGDVFMDFYLPDFIDFSLKKKGIASLFVHPNDHPHDSDLLETDKYNKITTFYPKPHNKDEYHHNLVSAAAYVLFPRIFPYIPKGQASDFGRDIFPKIINGPEPLFAYKSSEYVKDIGTPSRLEEVLKDIENEKPQRRNKERKQCCIFLDRDGVINFDKDGGINSADEFELIPGTADAIRKINKSDFLVIVISNQAGIAKGFLSFDELERIHKKMESLLGLEGAYLDGIYFCPHHPESGFEGEIKELKKECACRKPKPGMFLDASQDFNIDLHLSYMIGDRETDILAGDNAHVKKSFVIGNFNSLSDLIDYILEGSI